MFERVRVLCQNLDFVKMHKSVEKEIDPERKRYSQGLNMGYLGYYEPSELRVQMAANMRRGRLLRKPGNNTDYTYAYDKSGNLLQIYGPGKPFETLCYSENDTKAFVTFDACYTIWDNPGILCTTFAKYDPAGYPETILAASWMSWYDKKTGIRKLCRWTWISINRRKTTCRNVVWRHYSDTERIWGAV